MKKTYIQRLNLNQFKLTSQRRAIFEVLENNKGRHLSAEEVFLEVRKKMPGIGIATVYRTLELLENLDILHKGSFDEGKFRYELSDEKGHFHHHFICVDCGRIDEVREDYLQLIETEMERKGYQVSDHNLKLYGYCPECKKGRK